MLKSVYIHIPFCKDICSYCDFCKMYYNKKYIDKYLNALEQEIKKNYKNQIIETIYVGGGTPSILSLDELNKLFSIINIFKTSKNLEFTIECNPDVEIEKIELFRKNKVNRLSFGIESFNNKVLKILNRNTNYEEFKEKLKKIRDLGFNNINLDLIYAIPTQNKEDLKDDIEKIISLDPEHISTYSLILEKNTKLYIDGYKNIDEEKDLEMYNYIIKKLNKKYIHYEISNFSKENYKSKHNLTYWNNLEYYGFGLGASGYINNIRYTNTRNLKKYLNYEYINEEEKLDLKSKMEYEMILGLRKLKGVNTKDFYKKYNKNIEDIFNIKELLENKKLIIKDDYIFINPKYIYTSNDILINFIGE